MLSILVAYQIVYLTVKYGFIILKRSYAKLFGHTSFFDFILFF